MIIIIYYNLNKNNMILIKSYISQAFFLWTLILIEHNTGYCIGYIFRIRICTVMVIEKIGNGKVVTIIVKPG